jgi:acyl dehydratase
MPVVLDLRTLHGHVGEFLGSSDWHDVTQERIDAFADATGDWARIHTDPAYAAATPAGTTIAHGLYTLSLGPKFLNEIVEIRGHRGGRSYGYDRARFTSPVAAGARLRMSARLLTVDSVSRGIRLRFKETFEVEGQQKPACVAEVISLYFPELS